MVNKKQNSRDQRSREFCMPEETLVEHSNKGRFTMLDGDSDPVYESSRFSR